MERLYNTLSALAYVRHGGNYLGFGGLGAAIECHRHGHDVEVYEAFPELKQLGDIISFGPNAGRIFYRWSNGDVVRRMRPLSVCHVEPA